MLKFVKQIRDPVLGWIWLTEEEVKLVDLCPFIQRLRYVTQLGLAHLVYPTARHTRFEHSLGVMHLATKMFQSLISQDSFRQLVEKLLDVLNIRDQKAEGLLQHLRIAALLHDIGHYPFSHSLDNFLVPILYSTLSGRVDLLPKLNVPQEVLEILNVVQSGLSIAKEHEWITYMLLTWNEHLLKYIEECAPSIDINVVKNILFINMLHSLAQLEVNIKYVPDVSEVKKYGREELTLLKLVSSIISSSLDADRIDYMLRDLYFTGASVSTNITLSDVERILSNVYVTQDRDGSTTIIFDEKARACLEGFVIARYNLYKWVYLHHKVTLMTTLMRVLYLKLIEHIDELIDEELIRQHVELLIKFITGRIEDQDVLKLTDFYVYTMLTLCYNKIVKVLGKTGKFILDSLLYRKTPFKPLWKRDVEFEETLRRAGIEDVVQFNRKIGILIYESYKNPHLIEHLIATFKIRLLNEIKLQAGFVENENVRRCLEKLCTALDRDFMSLILFGYAYFEPEVSISITSSTCTSIRDLMEVSPLTKSVKDAWDRSPKLFIYLNVEEIKATCSEECSEQDLSTVLSVLKRCIVTALDYAVRDLLNIHKEMLTKLSVKA